MMPYIVGVNNHYFCRVEQGDIIITQDGSSTLYNPKGKEYYHSVFGAIQESRHIFIKAGLDALAPLYRPVYLLEIGFGTGLNALLSFQWANAHQVLVGYEGIEAFPIDEEKVGLLNYPKLLGIKESLFRDMHQGGKDKMIGTFFNFSLIHEKFEMFIPKPEKYHLIFFDAFSPEVQPEMWTEEGFQKLYRSLKQGGILTTYSCKGSVKRAMKACGFSVEKIPGPPGKREFLRARK